LEVDPLVDITNKKLVTVRALLGSLFALILTLPFGFKDFSDFFATIHTIQQNTSQADSNQGGSGGLDKGLMLLLPFILGFSTSLVLSILNRLIDVVQTFFGVNPKSQLSSVNPKSPSSSVDPNPPLSKSP
jgi:hypothetical protein